MTLQENATERSLHILNELVTQTTSKRLETLLASFDDGWAKGWAFAVDSQFFEALDIKFIQRTSSKTSIRVWTQGSWFNFREGYFIYDTPKAYLEWGEALSHINVAFKVNKSSTAIPATNEPRTWPEKPDSAAIKSHIASFGQNYVSHTEETKKDGQYTLRVQTKRFAGYLEVDMYIPNAEKTALIVQDSFPISQDDFVEWLITGVDPMKKQQRARI